MSDYDPLPPLNQLRVFEAAARLLSFTQAGRELHLTQSAVSQQVKALETFVGRPLFVRRSQSIALTEAGHAYLPVVQRSLEALAGGTRSVFGRRDELHLTVQVSLSFGLYWLTPRLSGFLASHPDITINIVTALFDPERTAEAADVEIRVGENVAGATLLRHNRYFPVAAPEVAENADWRTGLLFDCTAMHNGWRTWLSEQDESLPQDQRVHLASTYAVGLMAAESSGALTMTLDAFVESSLADGRLVQPFDHISEAPESYWLLDPRPGRRSDAASTFRHWLLEQAEVADPGS